jgi:hypothetical protein
MTEEIRQKLWDEGWKAYWDKKGQDACTTDPDQEMRDAWMDGWLTAQSADTQMPHVSPEEDIA